MGQRQSDGNDAFLNGFVTHSVITAAFGVWRVSRRFEIFGVRHVLVPLSNILECGNSLPL